MFRFSDKQIVKELKSIKKELKKPKQEKENNSPYEQV